MLTLEYSKLFHSRFNWWMKIRPFMVLFYIRSQSFQARLFLVYISSAHEFFFCLTYDILHTWTLVASLFTNPPFILLSLNQIIPFLFSWYPSHKHVTSLFFVTRVTLTNRKGRRHMYVCMYVCMYVHVYMANCLLAFFWTSKKLE